MNASDLSASYDLVVIGGGPAGLAAAATAARAGLATVLFDENPGVGGQIYRGITANPVRNRAILGEEYWAGSALAADAKASGALIVNGATVWSLDRTLTVGVSIAGQARMLTAKRVIIATGSLERPFPIPGWTLPGVMTAGGAQTLLKAQGLVPTGRTVMAGNGPLLWLLAAQILRAGGKIEAILDTSSRLNWIRAAMFLPDFLLSPYFRKGLALLREVKAKVDVISVGTLAAVGTDKLKEVVADGYRIPADLLLLHQGVVPNVNLAIAAGVAHRWNNRQLCFAPVLDADFQSSVPGIAVAGDGAGILIQTPDAFLREEAAKRGISLPPVGEYGVGMVFLPKIEGERAKCENILTGFIQAEGQTVLGWRDVPVDNKGLSESVKAVEPFIRQIFIGRGLNTQTQDAFERKLFVIRKQAENAVRELCLSCGKAFYLPSFSSRTLVYKGMLLANQVGEYFLDLQNEALLSALALVHQRFSTNTFPTWDLAHPFRMIAHNGEINTVRGNVNWMAARRYSMSSELLGEDLDKLWPLIADGQSDSACFDNALELLVAGGYSLVHAMMLLIPEAWAGNPLMDEKRRAFY
ncbi:MAG: FAD-dependent oxidoreductase, partial [Enhydrobacter sp.]